LAQQVLKIKKGFAIFNNHARANAPTNAIMLSQELGLQLKAMPSEVMVANSPQLVRGINPPAQKP
jgi:uncharacterized protein YecE (DUF72 family)